MINSFHYSYIFIECVIQFFPTQEWNISYKCGQPNHIVKFVSVTRYTFFRHIDDINVLSNYGTMWISLKSMYTSAELSILFTFCCVLGLYSLSGKTSYRQISWSLEAARLGVIIIAPLWNLTGTSAALLPRACQISERLEKSNTESRDFKTSRDLAVRRLTA